MQYEILPRESSYLITFTEALRHGGARRLHLPMRNYKQAELELRGLREECKGQGTPEWFHLHRFRASSTLTFFSLPKSEDGLPPEYIDLLKNSLGLKLHPTRINDNLPDPTHAAKSKADLLRKSKDELERIVKSYGRPCSGNKNDLVARIQRGPLEVIIPTDIEMMLKHTFFAPLKDKDKTPHKLGILNEDKVRSAMSGILKQFGLKLSEMWDCGLISRKDLMFLVTSLDGWIVYFNIGNTGQLKKHMGLEIKSPSSVAMRELVER